VRAGRAGVVRRQSADAVADENPPRSAPASARSSGLGSVPPILDPINFGNRRKPAGERNSHDANSFRTPAAISAAAAVVAALTLVAAPTAHAQTLWGGIATNPNGRWAIWYDKPTQNDARYWKFGGCGDGCSIRLTFTDCAALAYNRSAFSPADGGAQADAESAAMADLPGGRIVASGCNGAGSAANGQC
jgi:hypothetical protein